MLSGLSSRQRQVLIGLGLANLVLLIALGALALSPAPPPLPEAQRPTAEADIACQPIAARLLSQRNVAGTVVIRVGDSIGFVLSGDDPAAAWDAFAVSAELPSLGCGPYHRVQVDVPDPSRLPNQRLIVEARWPDVQAWVQGHIDDAAFSERAARATYTRPALSP